MIRTNTIIAEGLGRCELCKRIVTATVNADDLVCDVCANEMYREFMNEEPELDGLEELR